MIMNSRRISEKIFLSFHQKAYENDFNVADTKKALSWAEQASVLMENPEHAGNLYRAGENDPRASPEIIGILLELAAVQVSKHLNGKDTENKVSSYTEKLLSTQVALTPIPEMENDKDGHELHQWMLLHVPVLHGMKLAQTLQPGTKHADELRSRIQELSMEMSLCKRQLKGWKMFDMAKLPPGENLGPLYGLTVYEKLIGTGSI